MGYQTSGMRGCPKSSHHEPPRGHVASIAVVSVSVAPRERGRKAGTTSMDVVKGKLTGWILGGALVLGFAGPLVTNAEAQRGYYRDRHGHRHRRHGGIGPGKGALIGGAAGTGIGALVGGGKGALIGGAVGAGGGALAGKANQDHRHNDARRYDEYGRPR